MWDIKRGERGREREGREGGREGEREREINDADWSKAIFLFSLFFLFLFPYLLFPSKSSCKAK